MAGQAHVEDSEALLRLRAQIVKFLEILSNCLTDATADVQRTMQWLELDRSLHWRLELRKREEKYQQALEALRHKQLFKGPSGERQSDVDEQKRVKTCRAAVEEAQQKQKAVAAHKNRLSREATLFNGAISRLGGIANQSGPAALAELKHLILALDQYAALQADAVSEVGEVGGVSGVTRPATEGGSADTGAPLKDDAGVNWKSVRERARAARALVAGEVLVEEGALETGRAVLWRDFLKGRIFVGLETPSPGAACLGRSLDSLLAEIVGLPDALERPGDRCVVLQERAVVWAD